jgi:hypothetical protein
MYVMKQDRRQDDQFINQNNAVTQDCCANVLRKQLRVTSDPEGRLDCQHVAENDFESVLDAYHGDRIVVNKRVTESKAKLMKSHLKKSMTMLTKKHIDAGNAQVKRKPTVINLEKHKTVARKTSVNDGLFSSP